MRDRIDSRALSLTFREGSAGSIPSGELASSLLDSIGDIDRSLSEVLESMEEVREARIPADARLFSLKSWLLRILRVYSRGQDLYNHRNLEALRKLQRRQSLLEAELRLQRQVLTQLTERPSGSEESSR